MRVRTCDEDTYLGWSADPPRKNPAAAAEAASLHTQVACLKACPSQNRLRGGSCGHGKSRAIAESVIWPTSPFLRKPLGVENLAQERTPAALATNFASLPHVQHLMELASL
jgi:hypothetical protein